MNQNDVIRYQILKEKVESITLRLETSTKNLDNLSLRLKDSYRINNEDPVIIGQINTLKNSMTESAKHLKTVIIPSIDSSIS